MQERGIGDWVSNKLRSTMTKTNLKESYVSVNGLDMYYEVHGNRWLCCMVRFQRLALPSED